MISTSHVDPKKIEHAQTDKKNNKKKNGVKNDRIKKKTILNDLDAQMDDLLSGEELSFGSSGRRRDDQRDGDKNTDTNKKYKNTERSNASLGGIEFSVGSTNKGVKTVLKTGNI